MPLHGRTKERADVLSYLVSRENQVNVVTRGLGNSSAAERVLSTPELLQLLNTAVATALGEPSPVLAIVGDEGVGKTALLSACASSAALLLPSHVVLRLEETELDCFLRSLLPTIIVFAAIPVSVIGTFVAIAGLGLSINVISLAGLAFAVGMVVDASIVSLENIFRLRQRGLPADTAAYHGARQVWAPILGSALTTVTYLDPKP